MSIILGIKSAIAAFEVETAVRPIAITIGRNVFSSLLSELERYNKVGYLNLIAHNSFEYVIIEGVKIIRGD